MMKERVHEIPAFFHTDTNWMLKQMQDMGIDTSKCYICGTEIVKTPRAPIYLREKWDAWRHGKKYYDWNIGACSGKGVVCDKLSCFSEAIHDEQEERTSEEREV